MTDLTLSNYDLAVRDFQRARREAALQQILTRLQGKSDNLLCYDDVRQQLRGGTPVERGLQEIPLEKIVGSVGRYQDFTRTFLPKKDSDQERWARVKLAITDMKGLPPIELYQIGDIYFVKDGNHRVSVAHQLGSTHISAYVTEIESRVPLTADDDPDQIICKARYASFLEQTNLDKLRPEADLLMTVPGQYDILAEQISAEHKLLQQERPDQPAEQLWPIAVTQWYDHVYLPIIEIIREQGLMRRFPSKIETDLYVLLSEQREELEGALGWSLDPEAAVTELFNQPQNRPLLNRMLDSVAPTLEEGPIPGAWRNRQLSLNRENHLFEQILVVLEGIPDDERMMDHVIDLGKEDDDHILGLYIAPDQAAATHPKVEQIRTQFEACCKKANLRGEFAVDIGQFAPVLLKRAAWADLIVINLTHPPGTSTLDRLRSGWITIIERSPRPIMAIPHAVRTPHDRMLLAYDGSAKADEALFIAAYLALRWERQLTVLTVTTSYTTPKSLDRARSYLEKYGLTDVTYVLKDGSINDAILETAAEQNSNLLIFGGFGRRPTLRLVLGSTVEHLLRESPYPMLICR